MTIQQVIEKLKSGEPFTGEISNLNTQTVKAKDALLLAQHGYQVPEENIVYDDSDIAYDPEFDEVNWGEPQRFYPYEETFEITLSVREEAMKAWVEENKDKLNILLQKLLEDTYQTEQLLHGR